MSSETKDDPKNPFGAPSPWGSAYRGPVPLTPPPSSNFGQRAFAPRTDAPVTPPRPAAEPQAAPLRPARSSILSGSALPIGRATPAPTAAKDHTPAPAPQSIVEQTPLAADPVVAEPPGLAATEADDLLFDEPVLRTTLFEPEAAALETPATPREPVTPAAAKPAQTPEARDSATLSFAPPPARRRRRNRTGSVALLLGGGAAAAAAIAVVVVMSERASETGAETPASIEAAGSSGAPAAAFPATPEHQAAAAPSPFEPASERLSVEPQPAPGAPAAAPQRVAEARTAPRRAPAAARPPARINIAPTPLAPPPVQTTPAEPAPVPNILFDAETPIATSKPSE